MTNHVVSLDLAKQLKEAGYPQGTEFYWHRRGKDVSENPAYKSRVIDQRTLNTMSDQGSYVAAPLATELLEQLPPRIEGEDLEVYKGIGGPDYHYYVQYAARRHNEGVLQCLGAESLPDALAQMWLWLKKEGHL